MLSQISITFNQDMPLGSTIELSGTLTPPGEFVSFAQTWQTLRTGPYTVTQGTPTANVGERSAMNFMSSFNLDYNATSEFELTRNVNTVIVKSLNSRLAFTFGGAYDENTEPLDVDFNISEGESTLTGFTISFSANSGNPCDNIDITVESNIQADKLILPTVLDPINSNPFTFAWPRGQTIVIKLQNSALETVTQTVQLPSKIVIDNILVGVVTSPNGATITVTPVNTVGLDIEYSLDGSTWQVENVFAGIDVGSYTLNIRDQFGCVKQKAFEVPENGVVVPYFYISKANSIRFAKRITFGNSANYKNDENTLSCEVLAKLPYKEIQQFQSSDVITTQFKSNFDINEVVVIKPDASEITVPVVKKSQNLFQMDKRDAVKFDYGNGKTGFYFPDGNTYDYNSGIANGTYALNGTLPVWAVSGNYLVIANAWFLIEDVVFDESRNAEAIIIGAAYTGPDTVVVVGSIFNIENYEVYEFDIDFGDYNNSSVQVRIDCSGNGFTALRYLSERIDVETRHPLTREIRYRNPTNNDVFYSTGITHLIRQEVTRFDGINEDATESMKGDNTVSLLSSTIFEADEITFEPVTKELMRKIIIALSHEEVFIDLVGYVKGETEIEGPLEDTNLYVIKAKMIKSGFVYNSQGMPGEVYNGENMQIPGLVDSGTGFIGY